MNKFIFFVSILLFLNINTSLSQYGLNHKFDNLLSMEFKYISNDGEISFLKINEIKKNKIINEKLSLSINYLNNEILITELLFDGSYLHFKTNSFEKFRTLSDRHPIKNVFFRIHYFDTGYCFDGYYYSLNQNNDTFESGFYKEGLFVGIWRQYFSNGEFNEIFYSGENNYSFKKIHYYNNGNIYFVSSKKNNLLSDSLKVYYPNGNLKIMGFFKEGIRIKKWMFYYENGVKYAEGRYINSFYEYMLDIGIFKNGKTLSFIQKMGGIWKYYYKNGEKMTNLFYANNGRLKKIKYFSKGYLPELCIENEKIINIYINDGIW
jgi:antitoxin component YwqK of YwqJK toxin-antitoxin module